jgi:uncharacterized protein YjiS (DUF1127 family)
MNGLKENAMNTHRTAVRPVGARRWRRLISAITAGFKTWRADKAERDAIEALEALGPEILDDIGVTIVKEGNEPKSIARCNPYLIATMAMSSSRKSKR